MYVQIDTNYIQRGYKIDTTKFSGTVRKENSFNEWKSDVLQQKGQRLFVVERWAYTLDSKNFLFNLIINMCYNMSPYNIFLF